MHGSVELKPRLTAAVVRVYVRWTVGRFTASPCRTSGSDGIRGRQPIAEDRSSVPDYRDDLSAKEQENFEEKLIDEARAAASRLFGALSVQLVRAIRGFQEITDRFFRIGFRY